MSAAHPAAAALAAGLAHHRDGRLDAAAGCFRAVLAADPGHAEALHRLGLVAYQQGRPAEAAALIGQSLAHAPDNAGAHNNLALALIDLGRHGEAVACCDRAVALRPDHAGALSNRGIALRALGRPGEAAASLRRALALRPDLPEAAMNLGLALADLGQPAEALACHNRALALRPDDAVLLCNRGVALLALGRGQEALHELDRAAALRPELPDIHCNRGNALHRLGRLAEALAGYDRALALRPAYAEAMASRAGVLKEQGEPEAALASVQRALALDPRLVAAHACRGAVLADLGRVAEARESYARAVALAPGNRDLAMSAAVLDLRLGRLAAGWYCFEWRLDSPDGGGAARRFAVPRWRGEPLAGRTLLVHADQGYGDTIQFCRYLPLLAARGRVLFEVQPALLPLLRDLPGPAEVIAAGAALPPFDVQVPLLNVPGVFGTALDTIPPPAALRPDPARCAAWAARLPRDGRLRVGLAWSGNPGHADDRSRTMPLAALRPLAGCGARFHVVHTQIRDGDRDELARFADLDDLAAGFADFADTAAALAQLDLVIAVDTAVAHLAAALGRPTWIMLAGMPDWRWMLDREDSPWYPGVRLFRQQRRGDWAAVVGRVRGALDAMLPQRPRDGLVLRVGEAKLPR